MAAEPKTHKGRVNTQNVYRVEWENRTFNQARAELDPGTGTTQSSYRIFEDAGNQAAIGSPGFLSSSGEALLSGTEGALDQAAEDLPHYKGLLKSIGGIGASVGLLDVRPRVIISLPGA